MTTTEPTWLTMMKDDRRQVEAKLNRLLRYRHQGSHYLKESEPQKMLISRQLRLLRELERVMCDRVKLAEQELEQCA